MITQSTTPFNNNNEMQRIIDQVPTDFSKFSLDEKIELCNQGLCDLNTVIKDLNLNICKVFNQKEEIKTTMNGLSKSIKKRDNFLIAANVLSALSMAFVLIVQFIL